MTIKPSIYEIVAQLPGKLYVMPKPSGEWLQEDIAAYQLMGINHVVSLLQNAEANELGLVHEAETCGNQGIKFTQFEIADRGLPEIRGFDLLVKELSREIADGDSLAIHCRIGIGRAGVLASCVLQHAGFNAEAAILAVSQGRGVAVPDTLEQRNFIVNYSNQLWQGNFANPG